MGLLTGPSAAVRGARLLTEHKSLIPLALVPAGVACLVSFVGVWAALKYGDVTAAIWPDAPENWLLYALWWVGGTLTQIAAALGALIITPWLVMLVGLPLCGPLAEKADELLGGAPSDGSFWSDVMDALRSTAGMTAIGLVGAIIFFLLGLIPVVGLITTPFVTFVWTPIFLCFDLYDPVLARRKFRFRRKLKAITGRPFTGISVGLTGMALMSIPLVNLFGLPVAVLGGVVAVHELEQNGRLPGE